MARVRCVLCGTGSRARGIQGMASSDHAGTRTGRISAICDVGELDVVARLKAFQLWQHDAGPSTVRRRDLSLWSSLL